MKSLAMMSEVVQSGFVYRPLLVVATGGTLSIATCTPEPGMSEAQFNQQAVWCDRETAAKRRRGMVYCVQRHPNSGQLSPHQIPVDQVPADMLAKLDAPTDGLFLFTEAHLAQ